MKSPAIALMFGGPSKGSSAPEGSPQEEASESPMEAGVEGDGMSDVEAQHHAKVTEHHGKALAAFGRNKPKEAKVHVKLAMHHHAAAMKEAGLNDEEQHQSAGDPASAPGQPAQGEDY
jgi:hypothetical protein